MMSCIICGGLRERMEAMRGLNRVKAGEASVDVRKLVGPYLLRCGSTRDGR